MLNIFWLWLLLGGASAAPAAGPVCGYESCPVSEPGTLNVHLVAHTHDDVGWLKTVDQYYYGSRNDIQKAGVQYILDSVIDELWKDKSRRFIYVETAFFWKWWQRQHDAIRHKVHVLVREGRLEFIGGAWSMNDEADTHYRATIDQFTWGLRKLNDTFGECGRPRVGWQIDPFGHSREFASLLAAMGYDGLFHGRIDYADKRTRLANKTMEMLWRGSDDLGSPSDLFTGVLYNTYSPPPGFCFDVLCQDEPIIDDVDSPMYNVPETVDDILKYVSVQSTKFLTNNTLLTMGGDFTYQQAGMWYSNLDLLIKHTNLEAAKRKMNVKLFYSTPSCYLKAVHDSKPKLATKQDDFFPYASDENSFWTGYFTSRPTVKYFERRGNAYLQMVKQLQVLANLEDHNHFLIDELRSAMGVMQHHDAVTGTEKQHVADDYSRLLDQAVSDALVVVGQAFSKLMGLDPENTVRLAWSRCQLNMSQCAASEASERFIVTVYNPLAWTVSQAVRVPVVHSDYIVYNTKGERIASQLVGLPAAVLAAPTRHSSAVAEVVFGTTLPGLAFRSYYVQRNGGSSNPQQSVLPSKRTEASLDPGNIEPTDASVDDKVKIAVTESVVYDAPGAGKTIDQMNSEELNQLVRKNEYDVETLLRQVAEQSTGLTRGRTENDIPDVSAAFLNPKGTQEEDRTAPVRLSSLSNAQTMSVLVYSDDDFIENEHMKLTIDKTTGELKTLSLADGTSILLDIDLAYYQGCLGDNEEPRNRSSGAYIFRPNGTQPINMSLKNGAKIIKGPIVEEIHHEYSSFASSVIRLYRNSSVLEFEWLVGPIPIQDSIGKEVIVRYHTNLSNNQAFFTDSNGKQSIKRILNKRPQFDPKLKEPVAGNYYPVNSYIYIEDLQEKLRFTVLNDRAQGGSSLNEGQIELMVHRRLLHDDAFGVGEALNETAEGRGLMARGKHYISVGKIDSGLKNGEKRLAAEILQPLEVLVSNASEISLDDWKWLKNEWSALNGSLPEGVHLITLESWRPNVILLRVENIFEKCDQKWRNSKKTVDLASLFKTIRLTSVEEASLAANQWWKDRKRLDWNVTADFRDVFYENFRDVYGADGMFPHARNRHERQETDGFVIDLIPGEIRTFIVGYTAQ